ncbi:hypothetical protein K2173_018327 [Erythroxylum novogranatense]|uniref:UBA domain-containing protein n=1 Tax=Erythroxylum novogranatense TaxID=1862640 RepID=A0AAV8UCR9_9ROSI|nr:hypothetical protein K2173_018327 [Erythroxylum novogranatense]
MPPQEEMDVFEVKKQMLEELEDMGFPEARAARALHHSGNVSIEAAVNWLIDHENDPDIDQMPLIAVNIDIQSPQPLHTTEEMKIKEKDFTDEACRKTEEEKRLEREREKERIQAGNELLEAKRIAEDNERKRHLSSRKAEKEEEKRARERIRQKLEADKAERRRMLGLPPLSYMDSETSRPVMKEIKKSLPAISATKPDQLRECLRSLKRKQKNDNEAVQRAFQALLIYIRNVAMNPDNEKYRKIRIGNPFFQDRIGKLKLGIEFLELCGFEKIEGGKFLFLPREKVDMAVLSTAGSELKSAITNPFFGLLSKG